MKPGFALTLSHDGLRLLHRTSRGWMLVGDADLEDPRIEDTLRVLRKTAAALAPEGLTTKLVLPNSQILFTEVEAPGPGADDRVGQIEAALAGRTPYAIDELVYDWSGSGPRVKVAVVTRLTLQEAEDFAEQHGFNPLCFVAIPEAEDFGGEPFFGMTRNSAAHLPDGAAMDRDDAPVRIVGRVDMPKGPVVPVDASDAPVVPAVAAEDTQAAPAEEPAEEVAESDAPVRPADPEDASEPPRAGAAGVTAPDLPAPDLPAPELPTEAAAEAVLPVWIAESDAAPVAPSLAEVAERPSDMAPTEMAAPDTADRPVATHADAPEIDAPGAEVPEAPFAEVEADAPEDMVVPAAVGFATRRKAPLVAEGPASDLPGAAPRLGGVSNGVAVTDPVLPVPSSSADPLPPARPGAALSAALRKRGARKGGRAETPLRIQATPVAQRDPPPLRRKSKTARQESEEMTIFGARKAARVGGKPRLMGVMLVAALLFAMAAVALGSMWFGTDSPGAAPSDGTTTQSQAEPASVSPAASDPALDPAAVADGQAPEPDPLAGEPVADTVDMVAPADRAAAPPPANPETAMETGIDAALSEAAGAAPAPVTDAPAIPAPEALAALTPPAAPQTPPATVSPAPPPAAVAATLPAQSQPDASPAPDLAGAETAPATPDPATLPEAEALLHDAPLTPQPLPVPYGSLIKYGPDGLIIPSPEGVQTPGGITLFSGRPPLAPKVRPDSVTAAAAAAATPAPVADPAATPATAAPAPIADPALFGKRPQARPATLAVPQDQGAVAPDPVLPDAPLPAPVDPRHASLKPQARPEAVAALAATAAATAAASAALSDPPSPAAVTPVSAPVTGGTKFAVAQSRRPATKPSDFAKAVDSALAAAVAEPELEAQAQVVAVLAPQPGPEPAPQPAPEPAAAPAAEIDEPEPTTAAPNIPTSASVAKQATLSNAIDLGKINLIGVFGSSADRRALVRTSGGRYVRLKVGDRFDGGRVAAIGDGQLAYVKNGRTIVLKMVKAG